MRSWYRGTDFGYLGRIPSDLSRPGHDAIENRIDPTTTKRKNALRILRNMYDDLVPRWQGVVHTAEAETETRSTRSMPWADIKFSHFVENGQKKAALGSKPFRKWVEMGLPAAGEHLSMKELAQYKYHIDLGGGGESDPSHFSMQALFCLELCSDLIIFILILSKVERLGLAQF